MCSIEDRVGTPVDVFADARRDDLDPDAAMELIEALEVESRRLEAAKSDLLGSIGRSGAHDRDGHFSPKIMMRHVARLSAAEAAMRDRVTKLMAELTVIADAYRHGVIGTPQIRRLARTHSNPRVRQYMPLCEKEFLQAATELEYPDFDLMLGDWERHVDQDGADQRAARDQERRDVKIIQEYDLGWTLSGNFGALDGAEIQNIHRHFTDAERIADIEATKDLYGDDYRQHLPRSEQQLRADAATRIFRLAAGAAPGSTDATVTTNIVISLEDFEREVARMQGAQVDPVDPHYFGPSCRTSDGIALNAAQAVAAALNGHIRRVVFDSAGTTIDQGERTRLFKGSARTAAMLQNSTCYWPGCWVRASQCQIDHLKPHAEGGQTNPGNGAPACGRHNRLKENGYRAWRDPAGTWHVLRPDNTEIV